MQDVYTQKNKQTNQTQLSTQKQQTGGYLQEKTFRTTTKQNTKRKTNSSCKQRSTQLLTTKGTQQDPQVTAYQDHAQKSTDREQEPPHSYDTSCEHHKRTNKQKNCIDSHRNKRNLQKDMFQDTDNKHIHLVKLIFVLPQAFYQLCINHITLEKLAHKLSQYSPFYQSKNNLLRF